MGQAKQRGTYDERRLQAVQRNEAYRQMCITAFRAREERATPEEKALNLKKRQRIAKWLGIELDVSPDRDPADEAKP